jgi:hypothetical protein
MAKKPRSKKPPSKTADKERVIRSEKKLNPTGKVLWLLTSLSGGKKGYAGMSEDKMAEQLNISKRQLRDSLALVERDAKDRFRKIKPKGIHRVNQWHRVYLPKEEPHEFVKSIQCHPLMDVCVGLHWVAIDQVKDTGEAKFPANGLWSVTDEALRQARVKMNRLGYFKVESDPKTGKPARYILNEARFATAEAVEQDTPKQVELTKVKQPTTWATKQKKIEQEKLAKQDEARRQREAEEKDRQEKEHQHRQDLAASEGVSLEGKAVRGITASAIASMASAKPQKRIMPVWKPKIDENDL